MTEREQKLLNIIRSHAAPPSIDDLAYDMGYRPARKGRLAVNVTLLSLERLNQIGRLVPRSEGGCYRFYAKTEMQAVG